MNRNFKRIACFMATALLLTACAQDEMTEQAGTLPEGKYPLQIASVTMDVTHSEQPWGAKNVPQTRVAEDNDGNSSHWTDGDKIGVRIGNETEIGVYVVNVDVANNATSLTPETALYWRNKQPASVTAWYPIIENTVSLTDQTGGLAYVLKGESTADADYNTSATITFSHQLSKIRVVLSGAEDKEIKTMQLYSYTSCTHKQGRDVTGKTEGWITMHRVNDTEYIWEANVVPGKEISLVKVNETECNLTKTVVPEVGKWHQIDIAVKEPIKITPSNTPQTLNLNDGDVVNITDDGNTVSGHFTINIKEGNTATVNLNNVKMKLVSENNGTPAFNINGGGTIIFRLKGTENTIDGFGRGLRGDYNGTAANIHVIGPGKLTFTGPNVNGGIVTDKGKNIRIENATIVMDYDYISGTYANAAIGSGSSEECGDITIINSDISIKAELTFNDSSGKWYGAAIGAGTSGKCGKINITLNNGQSQDDFLSKITVTNSLYSNESLSNDKKVGKGRNGTSCGEVTWNSGDKAE